VGASNEEEGRREEEKEEEVRSGMEEWKRGKG